jgi:hypothetical protein
MTCKFCNNPTVIHPEVCQKCFPVLHAVEDTALGVLEKIIRFVHGEERFYEREELKNQQGEIMKTVTFYSQQDLAATLREAEVAYSNSQSTQNPVEFTAAYIFEHHGAEVPTESKEHRALEQISNLWPEPPNCAEVNPTWVGPNDGKMRAILLEGALDIARKALGKVA